MNIAGYTYKADQYCPRCIIGQLPTSEGQEFDGWALGKGVNMSTEANLSEIAQAFGIDREDEATYDSGNFPKVIFSIQTHDACEWDENGNDVGCVDQCGKCGVRL